MLTYLRATGSRQSTRGVASCAPVPTSGLDRSGPDVDNVADRWRSVVDKQSALRRVANRVARGDDRASVLRAVVVEAYALFDVDATALLSYERNGTAIVEAGFGRCRGSWLISWWRS